MPKSLHFAKKGSLQICQNSINTQNSQEPVSESEDELGNNNGSSGDWTISFLLFLLWAVLMFYIFNLAPNQTPVLYSKLSLSMPLTIAAGLGLITYAGLANGDVWKEFYQYFQGSKFIHATCIDFSLLSAFAPFWVYNDMTARKWDGWSWLLPVSTVPFLGPALYILLRPSLSVLPISLSSSTSEENDDFLCSGVIVSGTPDEVNLNLLNDTGVHVRKHQLNFVCLGALFILCGPLCTGGATNGLITKTLPQ